MMLVLEDFILEFFTFAYFPMFTLLHPFQWKSEEFKSFLGGWGGGEYLYIDSFL